MSDSEKVTAHIQKLAPALAEVVENIRQTILGTSPEIGEQIKWNNPCFYYTGAMKPFDPKTYANIIAVFNLFKGRIMLVFPSGANIDDQTGLLEGDYADGRRLIVFKDMADAQSKAHLLQEVLRKWLSAVV